MLRTRLCGRWRSGAGRRADGTFPVRAVVPIWLLALLAAIAGAGCGSPHRGEMVKVEPPLNWAASLGTERARKDDYFRRGDDTPLSRETIAGFRGLEYWSPDPEFYFIGNLHRYAEPQQFQIVTTAGAERPCERYGYVSFMMDGELQTLQVYRLLDIQDEWEGLLLPFRDGTTGAETYPSGRYVDLDGPPGGPFVLDFNAAYNPSCAYGDVTRFACPVTPPENRLSIRVEAGERGFVADES